MAIYCRVSTSDPDNDRRERDPPEYAEGAGFEAVGVFRETLPRIWRAMGPAKGTGSARFSSRS